MKTKKKTFDCVEMKRRGAARVYEKLKDLSTEQQVEYWRMRNDEMLRERDEVRATLRKKSKEQAG